MSLSRDIPLLEDRLTITPYLVEGLDLGFASDAFDGPNHFLLGVILSITYRQLEINASLSHAVAQKDVERDGLGEETVAGVGMRVVF